MKPWVLRGVLAVVLGVALGAVISLAPTVLAERRVAPQPLPWEDARLLAEVIERVKIEYVDRVDDHELIEAAIRGMIADLDPHSAFLDPAEYRDVRINTTGKYSGVGVEIGVADGRIVVIAPMDGSPAARAGVLAGDVIVSIDGTPVDGSDLDDAVHRMRGIAGSRVELGLERAGLEQPLWLTVRRSQVELQSVRAELLAGGEAYLRISHFTDTTPRDLKLALADLERQAGRALPGLVMDLRNNPGGVLEAAVAVADEFLDRGLIVAAEGRTAEARFRLMATPGDRLAGAPLTLLVNGGSASAAEIVAGALKDHGRAVLVGERTFGKGSVQTIMPLSDGRAIKLTTSRYYTPAGLSIQSAGIQPHERVAAGATPGEDAQLTAALAVLKAAHRPSPGANVASIRQSER